MKKKHIKLFRKLLGKTYKVGNRKFTTDEIRISLDNVSVWDADSKQWMYLQNDFTLTGDGESDILLKL